MVCVIPENERVAGVSLEQVLTFWTKEFSCLTHSLITVEQQEDLMPTALQKKIVLVSKICKKTKLFKKSTFFAFLIDLLFSL